ncbi:DNA polymerase III subunit delta' [Ferruginibacter sp. HRS2-29]|uniref:DNA polymerase III subunit n=1 Tax=Ferruginibacter sp. HRS2-29 TaxID=2487334 RepID=UPI0020CDABD6|nr:DNA polymerase III subunit delta' [Ferruginibacter sp. HRS2-29]MCP9752760.1 DNA polymerase III subunit delta' [Ferruginibacter sp. HRS2-29]
MQFSEVIGQTDLKEQLVHMISHNRLSHALLFLGKEGSGALSLAQAFAQYIVCEKTGGKKPKKTTDNRPQTTELSMFGEPEPAVEALTTDNSQLTTLHDSCGECAACQKAAKLIHPDIHFSYPIFPKKPGDKSVCTDFIVEWREFILANPYGNSYDWLQFAGAENKQGNINVYECNDIIRKLSLKSFEAEYKILIMWMPEALGKEGNKLLKLIEEPPANTLFILVAENDALVLPTILSRTQLVKVPQLNVHDIETALQLKENLSFQKASQIAAVSEGNYHEALHQLQHAEDDWESMLRDWLNSIVKTGPVAQVKWIEEMSKNGREKQKQFLKYFTHILEQAVRIRAIGLENLPHQKETQGNEQARSDIEFAIRFNKLCGIEQQEAIIHELDQATYYVERNANPKMLFHALTIKLYHIISNKSVILMQ